MTYPRGFRTVWSVIGAAALALLFYQAEHHGGSASSPRASSSAPPALSSSSSSTIGPAAAPTASTGAGARPVDAGRPQQTPAVPGSSSSSAARPTPSSSTSPPGGATPSSSSSPSAPGTPSSPAQQQLLAASAVVALPVRSASLAVRLAVVASGAPPFPGLPGVEASIGLPGL